MSHGDLPIGQIIAMLEDRLPELVAEFWPQAVQRGTVIYCNPKRDDLGSFQVFLAAKGKRAAGHWVRYSQGRGGNVLNLIAYGLSAEAEHRPSSYADVVRWAKGWLGLHRPETEAERRQRQERGVHRARATAARQAREAERAARHAADIWAGARAIDWSDAGNPVVNYLTGEPDWRDGRNHGNRGFDLAAIRHFCAPLRAHPALWHWTARKCLPAMIAAVVRPDGGMGAVHCTALDPGGHGKAKLKVSAKLMRGDVAGGFVPITLGPDGLTLRAAEEAGATTPLLVGEGIETGIGLACGLDDVRIWAALSIGNIAALAPAIAASRAISQVVVALENDVAPQAVRDRERVLATLEATGKPVFAMRSHAGSDFADLYVEMEHNHE